MTGVAYQPAQGPSCRGDRCGTSEARCAYDYDYPCCADCTHTFREGHAGGDVTPKVRRGVCPCGTAFTQTGRGRNRTLCDGCRETRKKDLVLVGARRVPAEDAARRYDLGRALELAEAQGATWYVAWTGTSHLWSSGAAISSCGHIRLATRGSPAPDEAWVQLCRSCVNTL